MAASRTNFAAALAFLVVLATSVGKTSAATYVVGDSTGWRIPPSGPGFYDTYASQHNFSVGDALVFNFPTGVHDLTIVSKANYDGCNPSNPISQATNGPATVNLTFPGEAYFICSFGGHCTAGQKLAINVSSAASPTLPPAPTPKPSPPPSAAPTPKPTPPPSAAPTPKPSPPPTPTPSPPATPPSPSTAPAPAPGTAAPTPSGTPVPSPAPGPVGGAPSPAQGPSPGTTGGSSPGSAPAAPGPGGSEAGVTPPPPPSAAPASTTPTATILGIAMSFGIGIFF